MLTKIKASFSGLKELIGTICSMKRLRQCVASFPGHDSNRRRSWACHVFLPMRGGTRDKPKNVSVFKALTILWATAHHMIAKKSLPGK